MSKPKVAAAPPAACVGEIPPGRPLQNGGAFRWPGDSWATTISADRRGAAASSVEDQKAGYKASVSPWTESSARPIASSSMFTRPRKASPSTTQTSRPNRSRSWPSPSMPARCGSAGRLRNTTDRSPTRPSDRCRSVGGTGWGVSPAVPVTSRKSARASMRKQRARWDAIWRRSGAELPLPPQMPSPGKDLPDFNGVWTLPYTPDLARAYRKPLPFTPVGEAAFKKMVGGDDPHGFCQPNRSEPRFPFSVSLRHRPKRGHDHHLV